MCNLFQNWALPKGQLISKENCQAVNSSKKRTNKFVFTTMWRIFIRFLEEIEVTKKTFQYYLTFKMTKKSVKVHQGLILSEKNCNLVNLLSFAKQVAKLSQIGSGLTIWYLAHVIEQPNFRTPNPQYLQQNLVYLIFCLIKSRTNSQQRHL